MSWWDEAEVKEKLRQVFTPDQRSTDVWRVWFAWHPVRTQERLWQIHDCVVVRYRWCWLTHVARRTERDRTAVMLGLSEPWVYAPSYYAVTQPRM